MALRLLNVGDHLSLEMDPQDLDRVRAHLRSAFADLTTEPAGIATLVRFGGCDFTFQNEWDDPCLISASNAADGLLRQIHGLLS